MLDGKILRKILVPDISYRYGNVIQLTCITSSYITSGDILRKKRNTNLGDVAAFFT